MNGYLVVLTDVLEDVEPDPDPVDLLSARLQSAGHRHHQNDSDDGAGEGETEKQITHRCHFLCLLTLKRVPPGAVTRRFSTSGTRMTPALFTD